MACSTHTPVVTTSPGGDYLRTDCRECGMSLPDPEIVQEVAICDFADGDFYCVLPSHDDEVEHAGYVDPEAE